jgi:hypothetical protein
MLHATHDEAGSGEWHSGCFMIVVLFKELLICL